MNNRLYTNIHNTIALTEQDKIALENSTELNPFDDLITVKALSTQGTAPNRKQRRHPISTQPSLVKNISNEERKRRNQKKKLAKLTKKRNR